MAATKKEMQIEANKLKVMKKAKTGLEMIKSWYEPLAPGEPQVDTSKMDADPPLYAAKKPEMLSTFGHNMYVQLMERGILDPKTRCFVMIACYLTNDHHKGIGHWAVMAKQFGATEEELLELAFAVNYANSKSKMMGMQEAMQAVLTSPEFKQAHNLNI